MSRVDVDLRPTNPVTAMRPFAVELHADSELTPPSRKHFNLGHVVIRRAISAPITLPLGILILISKEFARLSSQGKYGYRRFDALHTICRPPHESRVHLRAIGSCVGLLFAVNAAAADPAYVGRWKVNDDKTEWGLAFAFSQAATGELRFTQGDVTYVVRFDGKDYPHPLGGVVSWRQLDARRWETRMTKDGKVIGDAIYTLSEDGETLTSAPPVGLQGSTSAFRRTSGERTGLDGAWSHKTVNAGILQIDVA